MQGRWASPEERAGHPGCVGARVAQGNSALRHGSLVLQHDRLGGHDTTTARAWACLCVPGCAAGPVGCALGAPSLFLDSILFLSHFLGTVHEHCSSQKKFEIFLNKIK